MSYDSLVYFWRRRTLFIGHLDAPLSMQQAAASLSVSLGAPLLYRSDECEAYISATSVLTPAGASYQLDACGQLVANIMLDPYGEDYAVLARDMSRSYKTANGASFDSDYEQHIREVLSDIYQQGLEYQQAYQTLDSIFSNLHKSDPPTSEIDPRIVAVVECLQQRIDENLSIDDLAAVANLSTSRLSQLFRQQTGIPIRRYRAWHRLFVVAVKAAKTGNLTESSISAGFTDASHFTKTFHSMMGMCPSKLLNQPNKIKLNVE